MITHSFAYPWVLLFFIPFIVAVIYVLRKPLPSIRVSNTQLFGSPRYRSLWSKLSIPSYIYALAIGLLILALARPRLGIATIRQRAEGIDIMLAIDLSGSMQSIDVPNGITTESQLLAAMRNQTVKNRLEVAKDEIRRFIKNRPNDRIGLISFAPLPYVVCPPTLDHAYLLANLVRLQPGMIGDKTGIAGPIASAVSRLKDSDAKRKVIVLFTDGSNNVDAKITPRQAAKLAKEFGVVIYTVGIGSSNAVVRQRGMFGERFFQVDSQFDEDLLRDLAKTSSGRYYKAADARGLQKAMSEIDKLEKTTFEQPRYVEYHEWAPGIILGALLLLLAGFFLEHTLILKVP